MKTNIKAALLICLIILFGTSDFVKSQTRIAILYSNYSAKLSDKSLEKVNNQITFWELFLMQNKIPYEVIYDDDIESGIEDDFDILILPSVEAISSDELQSLKIFLQEGKSILSAGSSLKFDEGGTYNNINCNLELFDLEVEEEGKDNQSLIQTVEINPIINSNYLKYNRILLSQKKSIFTIKVQNNIYNSFGYLSKANLNDSLTCIAFGKKFSGKFAWFGFDNEDIIGGKDDQQEYKNLILGFFPWLDQTPEVYNNYLPEPYKSVAVILIEYNNLLEPKLIDKLKQDGFNPYLVVSYDDKVSELVKSRISDDHLILDVKDFNADRDSAYQNISDILEKFKNEQNIFVENIILNSYGLIDIETKLGTSLGIKNLLVYSSNLLLSQKTNKNLWLIPYNPGLNYIGGVSFLIFNPKPDCNNNTAEDFLISVNQMKSENIWITDFNSLIDWSYKVQDIKLSLTYNDEEKFVSISNYNSTAIDNFQIILDLPEIDNYSILSFLDSSTIINHSVDNKTGLIKLEIPLIRSDETRKILINTDSNVD